MGLFSKKVETRSQFITPSDFVDSGSFADITVTPDTALRLSSVWACVRLLADSISTMPLDVFRNDEEISVPPLLTSPAAGWTLSEWLYAVMVSLLLRGNAYGAITARSGPRLTPSQVELVNPDNVTVNVDLNGSVTYRYKGQLVDPSDLWHVRAFVYPGNPIGLSPISYAAETVGLSLAVQRFGRTFFAQGATPTGILSHEGPLNREQAKNVKEVLKLATVGKREPLIVSGGDAKWQSLSIAPDESQFVESRKLGVAEIARTFGVPPEMIGGEAGNSLTYANVEQRGLEFVRYSLGPWMVRLENGLSTLLPRGQSVKFNPNALLRGTTLERYQAHEIALKNGWMTVDEVRALEDLPPMPAASSPPSLQAVEGAAQ
jgi:HK97 family phage portal protein